MSMDDLDRLAQAQESMDKDIQASLNAVSNEPGHTPKRGMQRVKEMINITATQAIQHPWKAGLIVFAAICASAICKYFAVCIASGGIIAAIRKAPPQSKEPMKHS